MREVLRLKAQASSMSRLGRDLVDLYDTVSFNGRR